MPRAASCSCDECPKCKKRIYMREWYQRKTPAERRAWTAGRDPEKVRAQRRKQYRRDVAAGKQLYERPRNEHYASTAVHRALKRGDIVKEPCLFCGEPNVVAHHHSYAVEDRLNVTWLCRRHHGLVHAQSGF